MNHEPFWDSLGPQENEDRTPPQGTSALHEAAACGHSSTVKWLLEDLGSSGLLRKSCTMPLGEFQVGFGFWGLGLRV